MLCMTNLHDINGQINTGLIWISYNSLQHRSFPTAYNHPWTWGAWCGCPEICPAGGRRSIALLLLFHLPGIFRQMVQGWQRVLQLPPRYIREVVKKRSFNGQADRKGWPPSPPYGQGDMIFQNKLTDPLPLTVSLTVKRPFFTTSL